MSVRHVDTLPAEEVKAGTDTKIQVLIGPDQGPNFALRRFIMEPGGGMPLHTNKVEHEQYVLRGSARVQIGDDMHEVKAGDVVYIPGGVQHNYEAGDDGFEFLCVVPNQPDEISLVDC
ncbi:MAG: cupin domain-containing protein [Longimicrobiales bacterium]